MYNQGVHFSCALHYLTLMMQVIGLCNIPKV